jgi:hypothetical protein
MKVIKYVGVFIIVILLLVIAGLSYVASNLNELVKDSVQTVGSDVLQTAVTLETVDVQLMQSRVSLTGLRIANPPGFSDPNIFEMQQVVVDIDVMTLLDKLVHIEEIRIDGARVIAEQKGSKINLQVMQEKLAGEEGAAQPTPAAEGEPSATPDITIKLDTFNFVNSSTYLLSDQWGDREFLVPAINLQNVGGERGLPPEQFANALLKPILAQLNKGLQGQLKQIFKDKGREKLKAEEDRAKKRLDSELEKQFGDNADDVKNSLKGLFK